MFTVVNDVLNVPFTQIRIQPSRDVYVVLAFKWISTLIHALPAPNVATAALTFGLNHPVPSTGQVIPNEPGTWVLFTCAC